MHGGLIFHAYYVPKHSICAFDQTTWYEVCLLQEKRKGKKSKAEREAASTTAEATSDAESRTTRGSGVCCVCADVCLTCLLASANTD